MQCQIECCALCMLSLNLSSMHKGSCFMTNIFMLWTKRYVNFIHSRMPSSMWVVVRARMVQSCTSKSKSWKVSFALPRMHIRWALPISIHLTSWNNVTSHMSRLLTVVQVVKNFMSSTTGLWIVWRNCAYLVFMSHSNPTMLAL